MNRLQRMFEALAVGRRFAPLLKDNRGGIAYAAFLGLMVAVLEIVRPWPLKWIFDEVLVPGKGKPPGSRGALLVGVIAFFAAVALKAFVDYRAALQTKTVGHNVTRAMRYALFGHVVGLPPAFHARNKSGDILMRLMGDVPLVRSMLVDSAIDLIVRLALILGTVAVMLTVDARLTLILMALVPFFLLLLRFLSRRISILARKQRKKEGELADFMHEAIEATPVLQSLGGSEHAVRRFARSNRSTERAGLRSARLAAKLSASVETFLAMATALCLFLGGLRVLGGDLKPGELLLLMSYVRSLLKPVRSASRHSERIAKGVAAGYRLLDVFDVQPGPSSKPGALPAPRAPQVLAFDDVVYTYEDGTRGLQGFSAEFRRGQLSGLVGPNGAGKSTAVSLAARLFDPDSGAVRLDGQDLRDLDLDSVRATVAPSLQSTVLFGESIRENLLVAKPEAEDEELLEACRAGGFLEVLETLPDGLDTQLGRSGQGLSGGQRAMLALSRTLLRGADVVLVDEPFAGLDVEASARVSATLRALARDRIVIVVAHEPEHVKALDVLVRIEKGRRVDTRAGAVS